MNQLYPIFLKPDQVNYLIIGAGRVAEEKLNFLLKNSPSARVHIVGIDVLEGVRKMANEAAQVYLEERAYMETDIQQADVIIAATNIREVNQGIRMMAKTHGKLVNVADTPELCDFYLGGIVTKGDLKVAISTNGKSPTFAKRFRQLLENTIDEKSMDELLKNLHAYRATLTNDFDHKVRHLNKLTKSLIE